MSKKQISVYLTEEEVETIEKLAHQMSLKSVSSTIRKMIKDMLKLLDEHNILKE